MARALRSAIGVVALGVLGVAVVFVVGMRTKYPPVIDRVRLMTRDVANPRALRSAGEAGADAAVVRHVGRTSGRQYETPVTAVPTDDGFVIALPYGPTTDWLRNVLAAGSAVLVHEGTTHVVDRAEVVASSEVAQHFSPGAWRTLRLFGVEHCLVLHRTDTAGDRG